MALTAFFTPGGGQTEGWPMSHLSAGLRLTQTPYPDPDLSPILVLLLFLILSRFLIVILHH